MADEHLSRDEFLAHIEPIRKDIAEIVGLQRAQNGRVGSVETRVAVLEARDEPHTKRDAVGVSALVSAVINGVAMWLGQPK